MASNIPPSVQWRFLFTLAFRVLPSASFKIPGAIFRAWLKRLPLAPAIWNGLVGAVMANTPPNQLQAILPSTIDVYDTWVASNGASRVVDVLPADNSTRLLWIGPRKSNKVVLFFHGGGYLMPLAKGHLDWMEYTRMEAANAGVQLSVCVLEYDLIPTNPYPRQMMQGILALKHLLACGYRPSDIVFGGDSAGGHLSLSLMSHLHHPRPSKEAEESAVNLQGPVKGCFLVSPLSSYNFNTPSYARWFSADVLNKYIVERWGLCLVDNSPWRDEIAAGNGWGMALDVPDSWWDNFKAVDRILVTGGFEEVFSDHIQQLSKILKQRTKSEVALYMANEAHDGPLMDFWAGRPASETTRAIADFVIACFKETN